MRIWMLVAAVAALSACNTMRGLGEDIEESGRALQESAEAEQYEYEAVRRPASPEISDAPNTVYY